MAEKRPSLNVLSGPLSGQKFVLEDAVDNILIGSDPSCGFVLDTPGVSPIHARLWVDLNGATVYDTNSPTGVYVNDDRVVKEAPVRNGDILWLGPPGEEGSVLIQCILPPPPPAAAEGEAVEPAAAGAPAPSKEATAPIDSGATMAFGMPAYPDEPEVVEVAPPSAPEDEESDVESTVVMTSSDLMGAPPPVPPPVPAPRALEPEPEPAPTLTDANTDATALLDMSDGLEMVEEPTLAMPPPLPPAAPAPPPPPTPAADHGGFPDFEVEPTVSMAPPPLPPRAATPPPVSAAPVSEFEEDMEPTIVDVPAPPVARGSRPAAPAGPEDDDEGGATVMYRHPDAAPPPAPKPPAPPATPPRASAATPVAPAVPAPPVPPAKAAAPPAAKGAAAPAAKAAAAPAVKAATGPAARPTAEARPAAAKAPAAARPAAPPPRARAERPAAAPAAAPPPVAAPRGGGGSKAPLIAGAAVVLLALAGAAYWFTRTPESAPTAAASPVVPPPVSAATPPPVAARPPVTEAAAPPVTEAAAPTPIPEAITVVRSPVPSPRVAAATPPPPTLPGQRPVPTPAGQKPPTAAPTAAPVNPAQQTATAVANLMSQARAASDAKNYDAAVSMYDEVLKLEPHNTAATNARTAAISARTASRRTFVSGRTVVGTEQKSKGGLSGFDGADVVQKSDFSGRLEFAMSPATVKPGDPYRLTVALVNDGKKAIKISGMTYTVTVNGSKTGNPIMPKVREVGPSQRVVLEELPGVFPEATSWVAEVLVTANKGDSLKNQLTWR